MKYRIYKPMRQGGFEYLGDYEMSINNCKAFSMNPIPMPPKEIILYFLKYNKQKGELTWNKVQEIRPPQRGQLAGTNLKGYRRLRLIGKNYLVHRIIFFLEYGFCPEIVDHINGNKSDNKISNLRAATKRENNLNTYRRRQGKLAGATLVRQKKTNKWSAFIGINGKSKHLGNFFTEKEAHDAYMKELNKITSGD